MIPLDLACDRTPSLTPSPAQIRVLLVDDHPVFRAGLVSLLRLESDVVVVGQAGSGAAALRMWQHCQPDICLLDLSMPEMDGLETLRQIRKAQPKARVVMLTSSASPRDADRALAAGACGYVVKHVEHDAILDAVRAVSRGATKIQRGVAAAAVATPAAPAGRLLSPRELEVLQMLRDGRSTSAIATALGITSRTVKFHVAAILEKLGAEDRMGAIVKAFDLGLLKPSSGERDP